MEPFKGVCKTCGKEFWVIKQEQEFLQKMGLPHPTSCSACRQARRLKDRGERTLFKTTCQKCGKEMVVTFDPNTEKRQILCKVDYLDYFEKNSALIEDSTDTSGRIF